MSRKRILDAMMSDGVLHEGQLKIMKETARCSMARDFGEISFSDVCSMIGKPSIYMLIDDGQCVYVGQSTNAMDRAGTHSGGKKFDNIKVFPHDNIEANISDTEAFLIALLAPSYNKVFPSNKFFISLSAIKARRLVWSNKKMIAELEAAGVERFSLFDGADQFLKADYLNCEEAGVFS